MTRGRVCMAAVTAAALAVATGMMAAPREVPPAGPSPSLSVDRVPVTGSSAMGVDRVPVTGPSAMAVDGEAEALLAALRWHGEDVGLADGDEVAVTVAHGVDVTVGAGEGRRRATGTRVVVRRSEAMAGDADGLAEAIRLESVRAMALGHMLRGAGWSRIEVDWAVADGDGEAWLAMRDGSGRMVTASRPLDLLPQMDGFCLSQGAYEALGGGESHVPPMSGLLPVDGGGEPLLVR